MKKLFLPLIVGALALMTSLAVAAPPKPAQEPFRYSVLYDVKAKSTTPVIGYRVATLPDFLGTRLEPEVWSVAGVDLSTQRGVAGFAAVLPMRAARNLTVYAGAAALVAESRPVGFGLVVGLNLTFGGAR